jgi:hypothetical protein
MQKKSVLMPFMVFLFVLAINLACAYSYGYGGNDIISRFLNSIDSSTILLGSVFILSFALLHFSLSRAFKGENKGTATVMSLVIALLITWGINKSGLNFEGFFYNLGISGDFLFTIASLLIIGGIIFLIIKLGVGWALTIIGGLLILVSFTELVYQNGLFFILGLIPLIIGIIILVKKNKEKNREKKYLKRWGWR